MGKTLNRLLLKRGNDIIEESDPRSNAANRIYNTILSNSDGIDTDGLAKAMELRESTLYPHLKKLRDARKIVKGPGGRWFVVSEYPALWRMLTLLLVIYWLLPLFEFALEREIFTVLMVLTIVLDILSEK